MPAPGAPEVSRRTDSIIAFAVGCILHSMSRNKKKKGLIYYDSREQAGTQEGSKKETPASSEGVENEGATDDRDD